MTTLINSPLINNFRYLRSTCATGNPGLTSPILSIADGSNGQLVVTTNSTTGLSVNEAIEITGTTSYNGTFTVLSLTSTTFNISGTFGATETGIWQTADLSKSANAGDPLDFGKIYFYDNADRSASLEVYFDRAGTQPTANPLVLSQVGTAPPLYFQERIYYIEIYDKFNNLVEVLENYQPNDGSSVVNSKETVNFLSNGQFDFKYDFSDKSGIEGKIIDQRTPIALGWEFRQDKTTTTLNTVTFNIIAPNTIEGNPTYEVELNSTSVSGDEKYKDFDQGLGEVERLQGQDVVFSFMAENKQTGNISIEIVWIRDYGDNGSLGDETILHTFTVGTSLTRYNVALTLPSTAGKTIGANSGLRFAIRPSIQQPVQCSFTNCFLYSGSNLTVSYPDVGVNKDRSHAIGTSFDNDLGFNENYSSFHYISGLIRTYNQTGKRAVFEKDKLPADVLECDGSTLLVNDFTNDIPHKRLFDVIGTTYGSTGDLSVAAADKKTNLLYTINEDVALNPATVGNLGSKITLTNVKNAFPLGVKATSITNLTVQLDFIGYTPNQTPNANAQYQEANTAVGNGFRRNDLPFLLGGEPPIKSQSSTAISISNINSTRFNVEFISLYIRDYETLLVKVKDDVYGYFNYLEWSSDGNTSRGNYYKYGTDPDFTESAFAVGFYNDLIKDTSIPAKVTAFQVKFLSTNSMEKNVISFRQQINDSTQFKFDWVTAPADAEYFFVSSSSVDYYVWYNVSGSATDPAIGGRTGIEVDVSSAGGDLEKIRDATITATNSFSFDLPTQADCVALGNANNVWGIYL